MVKKFRSLSKFFSNRFDRNRKKLSVVFRFSVGRSVVNRRKSKFSKSRELQLLLLENFSNQILTDFDRNRLEYAMVFLPNLDSVPECESESSHLVMDPVKTKDPGPTKHGPVREGEFPKRTPFFNKPIL